MVIRDIRLQRRGRRLIEGGSLPLQPGKVTVLFGASGCGKSTLLYALADLDPDVRLATAGGADPLAREPIGLVPQQCAVFEDLGTAGRNLAFAHAHGHHRGPERPASAAGVEEATGGAPVVGGPSAGDPAERLSHDPAAGSLNAALDAARRDLGVDPDWCMPLSGGQKQRVAIARALVGGATVLLCDEPTSGLDPSSRREAIRCIRRAAAAGVAVLVVTHDLEWNHPDAADHAVLLRQSRLEALQPGTVMQPDWFEISTAATAASGAGDQDQQVAERWGALWDFVRTLGAGCWWFGLLPVQVLRGLAGPDRVRARWLGVFLRHFGRMTMGGSSLVYLAVAGLLVGFSSLYFTVGALDPSPHLQTLMVPELLSGSGFGLYRVIVPLIAALLVSAKCGSALAADIGNRQYGGQIGVMRTMGANPESYLLLAAVTAFAVGMPLLSLLAFGLAAVGSLAGYLIMFPGETIHAWRVEFFRLIQPGGGSWLWQGTLWNAAKLAYSGAGVAVVGYYCGVLPKSGNTDVGRDIARATLWGSLWCLLVFTLFALVEF